jgi:dephospho-CoA kinase
MTTFKTYITEGINDAGILKAVFIIGLPGAGKSYTAKKLKGAVSPKVVNTDIAAEFSAFKKDLNVSASTWPELEDASIRITRKALEGYVNSMLPLFVDGTSNNVSNILHRIGILESVGYDVGIVFVHASLETAIRRAEARSKLDGRVVSLEFIKSVDKVNLENAKYLQSKVDFFKQLENDGELDNKLMQDIFKSVQGFFKEPVKNPVGKRHLEQMKDDSEKYLSPNVISAEVLRKKIEGW